MYIYIYLYIYTHTRACARTHTHTKEAVHVGNNLASGRWSSWVILRRWRNKATSFCVFQSKAQRNTGTCMSSSSRPTEPKPLIAKLRGGGETACGRITILCAMCRWSGLLDTAGVIFSRKGCILYIHSCHAIFLFVCFQKAPWQRQG